MTNVFFLLVLLFLNCPLFGQRVTISARQLLAWTNNDLVCFDSSGALTSTCSQGLDGLYIEFGNCTYDKRTGLLNLVGRTNPPLPLIGIYAGAGNFDSLILAGETSAGGSDMSKDGYFEIGVFIKPNTSIFFIDPKLFVRRIEVWRLLRSNSVKKQRR